MFLTNSSAFGFNTIPHFEAMHLMLSGTLHLAAFPLLFHF